MLRLFYLMIGAILAFMFWRIIRIVFRNGGSRGRGEETLPTGRRDPGVESFKDVQDATFEDIQPPSGTPKSDS
jgi:hypothetical protein